RSYTQGRKACRPAGASTDQVRVGNQPQDRHGARPFSATITTVSRRRSDRITAFFVAPHESAVGPKRTWPTALHMSAFGGKADITVCGSPLSRSLKRT